MSCGIKRILQLKEAIQYQPVKVFDTNKDITTQCQYSWSTDSICWTNWTSYSNYETICKNIEGDFYLRILLFAGFDKLSLNGIFTNCYNICIDSSNTFLTDFCGNENLFQPYNNLDCALSLQQQLADSIVCMFGIPIYYFRVNPIQETADYTFKEYFLHQVDSVKQLKLMIPDGQMPSSNPKLTEFDFDWEVDWDTEISKTQFAKSFGDDAYPKEGDFIYIPMMKRMWSVNAAYDEKNEGLMWRSTTWKLALVKYTDSTNVDTNSFDNIIDSLTLSYEEAFGQYERNEQKRQVGSQPLTAPSFAATNLFNIFMEDAVRKQYTKQDIIILNKTYNQNSIVIGRNLYKPKNENGCIVYQKPICGDCGTLMFIIETGATLQGELERDIINFGNIQIRIQYNAEANNFTLKFGNLCQDLNPFESYMVMAKWNRNTFSTELNIYSYTHPSNMPIYNVRPEMYKFDFENPLCELIGVYNNDYNMEVSSECKIHPYPLYMTNIKYYNIYLSKEESCKESLKYTTKHNNCIINDLARPIDDGHGYAVK